MTDQMLLARKPSLLDLWMSYRFDSCALARDSGVDLDTVTAMLGCQPVRTEDAQKVLFALSTILHKNYTLETVYVFLIDKDENKSEIARIRALIQAEYDAGHRALYALAQGIALHKFMTTRTERIAGYISELREKYGEQVTNQIVMELGDDTLETSGKQSTI